MANDDDGTSFGTIEGDFCSPLCLQNAVFEIVEKVQNAEKEKRKL